MLLRISNFSAKFLTFFAGTIFASALRSANSQSHKLNSFAISSPTTKFARLQDMSAPYKTTRVHPTLET
ncbi:hypothetical protein B4U79_03959 [Dinothrombium tinctorium]|uniref:Uncharacterized protein n=1 Tax=Dinothrombium tinctorium TaxID=1965070 RepID=A0A3S3RIK9_9ACAR|nr:hypothetical protein B4U79_03959 [Dinothrombium tinctorium]